MPKNEDEDATFLERKQRERNSKIKQEFATIPEITIGKKIGASASKSISSNNRMGSADDLLLGLTEITNNAHEDSLEEGSRYSFGNDQNSGLLDNTHPLARHMNSVFLLDENESMLDLLLDHALEKEEKMQEKLKLDAGEEIAIPQGAMDHEEFHKKRHLGFKHALTPEETEIVEGISENREPKMLKEDTELVQISSRTNSEDSSSTELLQAKSKKYADIATHEEENDANIREENKVIIEEELKNERRNSTFANNDIEIAVENPERPGEQKNVNVKDIKEVNGEYVLDEVVLSKTDVAKVKTAELYGNPAEFNVTLANGEEKVVEVNDCEIRWVEEDQVGGGNFGYFYHDEASEEDHKLSETEVESLKMAQKAFKAENLKINHEKLRQKEEKEMSPDHDTTDEKHFSGLDSKGFYMNEERERKKAEIVKKLTLTRC